MSVLSASARVPMLLADAEPAPEGGMTAEDLAEREAALTRVCGAAEGRDPDCLRYFELAGGNETLARVFNVVGPYVASALRIAVIIAVAFVVQRMAKRVIRRFIRGLQEEGIERLGAVRSKSPMADTAPIDLARAKMRAETIGGVLRSVLILVVWTIATLMVLGEFNINLGPLIAGAGIVGVALGFGSQRLVQDFISGMFILMEDQYGIGDVVDTGEAVGTIELITLRVTKLRDVFGTVWYVPNGEIRRTGNMSQVWARALVDIGVSYDTDIDRAKEVILATATELSQEEAWSHLFIEAPEVWGVQELAPDEVTIRLVAKVTPLKQWAVQRELRARLKQALSNDGIEIPFPQRTVWVRNQEGDHDPLTQEGEDAPTPPPSKTTSGAPAKKTAKRSAKKSSTRARRS